MEMVLFHIDISSIQYNFLNLPQTITAGRGSISYVYDAGGNKLQKQTVEGSTVTTTLYMGGIVYQNNVLQFIAHEEGKIRVNSSNNGYVFDYYLKDQLGNTRMTITDDNTVSTPVIEATSYYPFGLIMKGISSQAAGKLENKFKYNGKEQQHQEFSDGSGLETYDFGHRMQDPQLGRFWQQDRFAEKYMPMSPYQYAADNPILFVDMGGDSVDVKSLDAAHAKAMSEFVHTKQGKKFIAQYASEGQSIYGVKFDKQGKYDKQHINISYSVGSEKTESNTHPEENKQGGININVSLAKDGYGFSDKTLNLVKAITHESFIHADMDTKDWLDDKKLNGSNLSSWVRNTPGLYGNHAQHLEISKDYFQDQNNTGSLWPAQALQVLKTASSDLGVNTTDSQIKNVMWSFRGSYIDVNSKSGNSKWNGN